VVLHNGDRLTGRITGLDAGRLALATDYAGTVQIDLTAIAEVRSDAEVTLVLEDDTRVIGRLNGTGQRYQVIPEQGSPASEIDVQDIASLEPGRKPSDVWLFSGRVTVGASDSSGNTEVTRAYADAEVVARRRRDRVTLGGHGSHAEDRGEETESNITLYGKYDRFFQTRWYAYLNTSLEHDPFKDLRLRGTFGVGSGFEALKSVRTNLSLEAGIDYVHAEYYTRPTESFPAMRLGLRFDYWLWEEMLQFFHTSESYANLYNLEQSFVRTKTGLRFPISEGFLGQAQLNLDWEGDPAPGRESVDKMVIFTLGYRW
jgi:putative salt-induced outer membrane protein YdiY